MLVSLFRRGKIWYLRYKDEGKTKWKSTKTADHNLAEILKKDFEVKLFTAQITGQTLNKDNPVPVADLFRRYLNHCYKTQAPNTCLKDKGRFDTIRNFLYEKNVKTLDQITPGLIQELLDRYKAGHSRKSYNNLLGNFKAMLNRAVDWGLLDSNPAIKIKPLKVNKAFNYFTPEEIRQIIKAAKEPLKTIVIILVNTGLRRAELFNLRWRDVDLKNKKIHVRPHGDFTTKNRSSRSIPISDILYNVLKKIAEDRDPEDFVCRPYKHIHGYRKVFVALLVKLGLKGTLHDLRHTFGTYCIAVGVPLRDVQAWMGHSDIQSTMIYAHHAPDVNREKINLLPY